jgi:hypothetical protein
MTKPYFPPDVTSMKREIANLQDKLASQSSEIESAKNLFSQLYQVLGAHDANENVLDAVRAAADGKFDFNLLPYFPLNDTDALNNKLAKANERIEIYKGGISNAIDAIEREDDSSAHDAVTYLESALRLQKTEKE